MTAAIRASRKKRALFNSIFAMPPVILLSLFARADESNTHQATLSSVGGRYVFGQVSEFGIDKFLLDTATGRLWNIVKDTDGSLVLQRVYYVMGDDEYSDSPKGDNAFHYVPKKIDPPASQP